MIFSKLRKIFYKKYLPLFLLGFILAVSLFFRIYDLVGRFDFAHDGDLASWIVKDIVVNHHFRLIGQLTTAEGIFIGPFYYYLIVPFYLLFNMDPVGAIIPVILMGVLTTLSYFFVFTKLFNLRVGLIAAFLQAVLISLVAFDRRIVPSTPTNLWSVWLFYVVVMLVKGRQFVLIILGVLMGLVWNIHIALAPALLAILPAIGLNFKFPKTKYIFGFFTTFFIISIPLILFEIRHSFSQTLSLINNFSGNHGGGSGLDKFNLLTIKMGTSADALFFSPQTFFIDEKRIFLGLLLLSAFLLPKFKLISWKELAVLFTWILGVVVFFAISSSPVSEYYFASINVILIGFVSLWLAYICQKKWGKYPVLFLLAIILIKNVWYMTHENFYHFGYLERKEIVDYIQKDAFEKGYPCVAVSYMTTPGENVGFRYLFWLKNMHINQPWSGSPVYTIVIPEEIADPDGKLIFDHIGLIPPKKTGSLEEIKKSCSGGNSNLTDPLFGYTE